MFEFLFKEVTFGKKKKRDKCLEEQLMNFKEPNENEESIDNEELVNNEEFISTDNNSVNIKVISKQGNPIDVKVVSGKEKNKLILTTAIVSLVVGSISGIGSAYIANGHTFSRTTIQQNYTLPDTLSTSDAIPYVVSNVQDGVVGITNKTASNIFSSSSENLGSGFIFSKDGLILTNYHVVKGNNELTILFSNGESAISKVVNYDETLDLAVLKVQGDKEMPKVLPLGDSSKLKQGETVIAIGNPIGKQFIGTVTTGVISSTNRELDFLGTKESFIQTDTAINPGNSGGPLLNIKGEVIGINAAKLTENNVEGIGFAIPINVVNDKLTQLSTPKTTIGISIRNITDDAAKTYSLPKGVYIVSVDEYSVAEKAGLKAGDVIVQMDGQAITTSEQVVNIKNTKKAGDTSNLVVTRNGKDINITLKY